jgi:hypothetical protein
MEVCREIFCRSPTFVATHPPEKYDHPISHPPGCNYGMKPWNKKSSFADIFEKKGFGHYIPHFKVEVSDISDSSDEQICGEVKLRIMLMALKIYFNHSMILTVFLKTDFDKGIKRIEVGG